MDRSSPDVVDVVLREGVGPLVFAAKRWPGEVLGSLVAGALCGIPVYVVMALIFSLEPGRIWALVGIAAVLGLVVNTFVILYGAFRDVNRLRFSPAASPDTMTVIRGSRTDRPGRSPASGRSGSTTPSRSRTRRIGSPSTPRSPCTCC
ncbi:hypothetical protein GCM10010193_14020 [Kitasatospora atroaurantiaca]|uniref:Uncharacterized protein n=1 Tax=Kitasatospora atroaurantiaca TaxID=285545 RepID=A0A561F215_9ACTN|nr:hypothetical protein FB465_7151 [Kitasatospora atroaurantiaca]